MAIIPGAHGNISPLLSRQKNKQTKMLYLLILIVVVAAAIYFLFTKAPSIISAPVVMAPSETELASYNLAEGLKTANLDLSLINDSKFKSLLLHGDLPVVVGQRGRDNPFAQF